MDEIDPADLMLSFNAHKDCAACSSARMFFEPGERRLMLLQTTLGSTDRTGEITHYLNSSRSYSELADRILEVLTDLNQERAEEFKQFVQGTANRQAQQHMWQFLLWLATVTLQPNAEEGVKAARPSSANTKADLSKMPFQPSVASTPMLAAPAAPPLPLPHRKVKEYLFGGDTCLGSGKVDAPGETGSAMEQMVPKYESSLPSHPTSSETCLPNSLEEVNAAPVPPLSLEATLSQYESQLNYLRQQLPATATIVRGDGEEPERMASASEFADVCHDIGRLNRAVQHLSVGLARQEVSQRRVMLTAKQVDEFAAAAANMERTLALLEALKILRI